MSGGHVFIDDGAGTAGGQSRIIKEYRANLNAKGQPGAGDVFFKWVLTHEWGGEKVTRVKITPKHNDPEDFLELPASQQGIVYDPSDRKFLAVAAAHPEHPPLLQSFDSKWWGWQSALSSQGITIHFLCEHAIQQKHAAKMSK